MFFPESLECYKLDDESYKLLCKYKKEDIELPLKLKNFIDLNIKRINDNGKKILNKEKLFYNNVDFRSLTLNIIQDCNMKCTYCYADSGTYGNISMMNFKTAKKVLKKLYNNKFNGVSITFFGGEPLLNFKLIKDVVEYIEKNFGEKPEYSITTNGELYMCHRSTENKKYYIGNIFKNNKKEIIENAYELFKKVMKGIETEKCKDCWIRNLCGGICH